MAANLVMANLSGHDSHGVGMLPRYVDAVLEGGLQPNAAARVTADLGTMLALDGQRGYGQVVGEQAMAADVVHEEVGGGLKRVDHRHLAGHGANLVGIRVGAGRQEE